MPNRKFWHFLFDEHYAIQIKIYGMKHNRSSITNSKVFLKIAV